MSSQEDTPAEVKFSSLMKRIRKLGLDTFNSVDGAASPAQMALIDWISANPGCGIQEIAEGLCLSLPTVSISVKRMEQNGILERKSNPADARSIQLFLTQHGQELYTKNQAFHRRKIRHLLSGLSQQEQETLIELLERALQSAEINILKK